MSRIKTTEEFIEAARKIHGDKYNYDEVVYTKSKNRVKIWCNSCQKYFDQTPDSHLRGKGCRFCASKKKAQKWSYDTTKFVKKAEEVHGKGKYDYSDTVFSGIDNYVTIRCLKHGLFTQTAHNHLKGHGCKECANDLLSETRRTPFLDAIKKVDNRFYPITPIQEYKNSNSPIYATCPVHGEFKTTIHDLLENKYCCPDCAHSAVGFGRRYDADKFQEVLNNRGLGGSFKVLDYETSDKPANIQCLSCGSVFTRSPNGLLSNPRCPNCYERKSSYRLEELVQGLLNNSGIFFEKQKTFSWLKRTNRPLSLDFYIPKYNLAIECQGLQHFQPVEYFGGEERFKIVLQNDTTKFDLCRQHGVRLLYFSDLGIQYPYQVFEDLDLLYNEIINTII